MSVKIIVVLLAAKYVTGNAIPTNSNVPTNPNIVDDTMKNQMDESVPPCKDFYMFTCGKYLKDNEIPEDKNYISQIRTARDTVLDQLQEMLGEPVSSSDLKPHNFAKNLYASCLNTNKLNELKLKPLQDLISNLGGWPVLDNNWDGSKFVWTDFVIKCREQGAPHNIFVAIEMNYDEKDNTKWKLQVDDLVSNLDIEKNVLVVDAGLEDPVVKAYLDLMVDVAVALGANADSARKDLTELLKFEIELTKATISYQERDDENKFYNPTTIKDLQSKHPFIQWLDFINKVVQVNTLKDSDIVIQGNVEYLPTLEELLKKTDPKVQANYGVWKAIYNTLTNLEDNIRNKAQKFIDLAFGLTAVRHLDETCATDTRNNLGVAVGSMYVRKYVNPDIKKNVEEMVKYIQDEVINTLQTSNWMEASTKQAAIDKMKNAAKYVAYPDGLLDDNTVNAYHDEIDDVPADQFFVSMLKIFKNIKDNEFKKLTVPKDRTVWNISNYSSDNPSTVNLFYSSSLNSIYLMAGYLMPPMFDLAQPAFFNYAMTASGCAHEFIHGLDSGGKLYDKNGNLSDWWTDKDDQEYKKRSDCFVKQYGAYVVPNINEKVNGELTLRENIADNGALGITYRAYNRWLEDHGKKDSYPENSKYTYQQLFWIGYGFSYCEKVRDEYQKSLIASDPHTPNIFRVNGCVSNDESFAKDFNCPANSEMNLSQKCRLF